MAAGERDARGRYIKGKKTGGRPKGSQNVFTKSFRTAVLAVFDQMGGTDALYRWAMKHPGDFYRVCAKLLPRELVVTQQTVRPLIIDVVNADDIAAARDRARALTDGSDAQVH